MGIRTPVSSNYAMTLGGLQQGVTPLDMAHAYETFIERGRRVGGTLGAGDDGPVGIRRGARRRTASVRQARTSDRRTRGARAQRRRPDASQIMTTVVSQGTGRARGARPGKFAAGKTGTTEN